MSSCRNSEHGVATGVGHDRVGQAKPSASDNNHGRRATRVVACTIGVLRARQARQGIVVKGRLCHDRDFSVATELISSKKKKKKKKIGPLGFWESHMVM